MNSTKNNNKIIEKLQDIIDICNSPKNVSYEYDSTPTSEEKLENIDTIARLLMELAKTIQDE